MEVYVLFGDFMNIVKVEDLEVVGVGEDWFFLLYKIVQIVVQFYDFLVWVQLQVEGVVEDNLCVSGFNFFWCYFFYGVVGVNRYKIRCFYYVMIKDQVVMVCVIVGGVQFKFYFFFIMLEKQFNVLNQCCGIIF